jgi:hypothetical protein
VHEDLTTCLEQAILLVHRHDGVTPAASLPSQSVSDASLADVFVQPEPRPYNENRSEDPARRGAETIASRDTNVRPAKGLALVTAHHEAAPEIVESIQQCLKETEAAYWADIAAKTPLEAVALLTANLRVTRAQLAARFAHHGDVVPTLFENQLLAELDAHGDTSYGRHLSISVRELYPVQGTAAVTSRVA